MPLTVTLYKNISAAQDSVCMSTPVAWLNAVNEIVVSVKDNCVWRLTGWHVIYDGSPLDRFKGNYLGNRFTGGFLEFDNLLVGELRSIVNQLIAVIRVAIATEIRFGNAAAIDLYCLAIATNGATEKRCT